MSIIDHLEKMLAENYRKEIDQEENVWRSLPFFAATLALQLAAVVGLAGKLPPLDGAYFWWVSIPIWSAAVATLATLVCMTAAIAPARFRYVASEPALRDYALQLLEAEVAQQKAAAADSAGSAATERDGPSIGAGSQGDALSVFKRELALQYGLASHNNRRINQRRAKLRSVAGLCVLASVLATLVLVGVTFHFHVMKG